MNKSKYFGYLSGWLPPKLKRYYLLFKDKIKCMAYSGLLQKNKTLEQKYSGQRCFILGSGTSIIDQDLKLLKNDVVIALNNFARHPQFDFLSESKKDRFYLIAPIHPPQTSAEWETWLKAIFSKTANKWSLWLGLTDYKQNAKVLNQKHKIWDDSKVSWYFAGKGWDKFDRKNKLDFTKPVIAGGASSIYALQLAIFLGFKDIYLLGMDHDYLLYPDESKMRFYTTSEHQQNELERTFGGNFYIEEFNRQYNIFNTYKHISDSNPTAKIWNASPKGLLNIFPRVNYSTLFGDKEKS